MYTNTKENIILSIIIPVFNVEQYLSECLDSIFNQDISNCEIIVVNDGSTDDSLQILKTYQNRHAKLIIINQLNQGAGAARNRGILNAKGNYLYFVDSDDHLLQGAISHILLKIEQTQAEIINFNALTNKNTNLIPLFYVSETCKNGIDFFRDFYTDNNIFPLVNPVLYVFRHDFLLNNHLKFEVDFFHEDILFTIQALYKTQKIYSSDTLVYFYRMNRPGSLGTSIVPKNVTDKSISCRKLDVLFSQNHEQNICFYNFLFYTYIHIITQAFELGDCINKKQYFNKNDIVIMRKGVVTAHEYKLWKLACLSPWLMAKYYFNTLPSIIRRIINISFTTITYFQHSR